MDAEVPRALGVPQLKCPPTFHANVVSKPISCRLLGIIFASPKNSRMTHMWQIVSFFRWIIVSSVHSVAKHASFG